MSLLGFNFLADTQFLMSFGAYYKDSVTISQIPVVLLVELKCRLYGLNRLCMRNTY